MINLTENDIGRLKNLSYDEATIDALEKLFLKVYLETGENMKHDVYVLASSRLAIDLLITAFKKLDGLKKVEIKKQNDNENPVL